MPEHSRPGLVHGGGNILSECGLDLGTDQLQRGQQVCHIGPQVPPLHLRWNGMLQNPECVGRQTSRDDDLWLFCNSLLTQLVHVDTVGFCIDFVGSYFVELAGEFSFMPWVR